MASDIINNEEYSQLMNEIREKLRLSEDKDEPEDNIDEKLDFQNFEFELVTGFRSNSKLLWVPEENSLYKQNTYSKTYNGMAYTCYNDECKARKVLTEQGQLLTIAASHVTHLSMQPIYKELHYLNVMKEMCKTEPIPLQSPIYLTKFKQCKLFRNELSENECIVLTKFNRWEADEECSGPFPIVQGSVEKTMMNLRNEKFRKAPTHCNEIDSIFEDELMSSTFCYSFHKERYRLYDTTFSSDEFGYCIYSSKKSINLIKNSLFILMFTLMLRKMRTIDF